METKQNVAESPVSEVELSDRQLAVESANTQQPNVELDSQVSDEAKAKAQDENGTRQEHIREALELLYVNFPKAFIKDGDCKPLKVGILDDLKPLATKIEGLSISKVRAAVRIYTTRLRYFYAVREGAMRVDLDGNEVEAVTAEHAEYARQRFAEINVSRRPRPQRPKKPSARPGFKKRPFVKVEGENKDGESQNRPHGRNNNQRQRFNRDHNNQRRYEPAKPSDIRVGAFVQVATKPHSYVSANVAEEYRGGMVSVTTRNGLTMTAQLENVFIAHGGFNNRPKRNFDRRPRGNFRLGQGQGQGANRPHNRNNNGEARKGNFSKEAKPSAHKATNSAQN